MHVGVSIESSVLESASVVAIVDAMMDLGKKRETSVRNTLIDTPVFSHPVDEAEPVQGETEFDNPTLAEMTRELKGCGYTADEVNESLPSRD